MSVTLTVHEGKPAVELVDHKGEVYRYVFTVVSNTDRLFSVRLRKCDHDEEPVYLVQIGPRWHACDCPHYRFRARKNGELCKHLDAVFSLRPLLSLLPAVAQPQEKAS